MRELFCIAIIALGVSLAGIAAASAYPAPSANEIETCTPDAFRLCGRVLFSGRAAVFTCMRANKRRLSPACRAVFERHGL